MLQFLVLSLWMDFYPSSFSIIAHKDTLLARQNKPYIIRCVLRERGECAASYRELFFSVGGFDKMSMRSENRTIVFWKIKLVSKKKKECLKSPENAFASENGKKNLADTSNGRLLESWRVHKSNDCACDALIFGLCLQIRLVLSEELVCFIRRTRVFFWKRSNVFLRVLVCFFWKRYEKDRKKRCICGFTVFNAWKNVIQFCYILK